MAGCLNESMDEKAEPLVFTVFILRLPTAQRVHRHRAVTFPPDYKHFEWDLIEPPSINLALNVYKD